MYRIEEELHKRNLRKQFIKSWSKMQKMIKEYFMPSNYHNCKERNRSVDEYTKELYRLHIRNNMDKPELRIIIKYIDGLRHEI